MSVSRRVAVGFLFVAVVEAEAARLGMRAGRSGSPPPPAPPPAAPLEDVPGPSGALGFTADFGTMSGVDGVVVYYDTVTRASDDPAAYAYRKVSVGNGQSAVTVGSLAAGTYYWRAAGYTGSTVGDLSEEFDEAAA